MPLPIQTVPVFVSSTWEDLRPEREAVKEAVLSMKETQFVGMEYFGSRDETTRDSSLDEVDGCRVYVGILGGRYGSGITEDEYRRARELDLPCFIYLKDEARIPVASRETDPARAAKLDALKAELKREHSVSTFRNADNLATKVATDLHGWLFKKYLTPLLERAARGMLPPAEAQQLLDGIESFSGLDQTLLSNLRLAGFNVAAGEHAVAVSGEDNQAVSGDRNVVVNRAAGDVVKGDKIIYETPAPPIPTLHQLRAPVGDFVGREKETADLLATLRGGASAAITGISGMGGIGKTELSFYVAERLRDTYPDAQLVLDMRGTDERPRDPADALASCIRAFLGLEQRLPDDTEELTRLYRSVLEGRRALILLDNASDSAQVRPLLPPAGSALLVTSRETIPIPGMKRVTLEQLRPVEARELLTGIAPRVPADIADRICYLCGYLPLAVRAAASLLDITPDLDPEVYAAQLADERTRLERIGVDPTIGIDVEASIGLSYQRLPPDAARVFRHLGVFPATFDAAAEEAVCEDEGHKHLSELLRRNLVIFNADTRRYRLHDLARLFADSRLSDEGRSAGQTRHATNYLDVLGKAEELYKQGGESIKRGLALFDLEWRNIQAGQSWAEKRSSQNDTAASICSSYPKVGGYALYMRQHPRERILWLEAGLTAARQRKDRVTEGMLLGNLGITYANVGETSRAINYFEQCLSIDRELNNLSGEAVTLSNLGAFYRNIGESHRAIECLERSLKIVRILGHRRTEGRVLGNLGSAYVTLGYINRGKEFYEQHLTIARETNDSHSEADALGELGVVYAALGEPQRAIEFQEQYLALAREIGDRRGEGYAHFNISLELNKLGEHARAISHAEAALKILEQMESPATEKVRLTVARWRGEATKAE